MQRLRPLLNTLLGLIFLVQGYAVAAAPGMTAKVATSVAASTAPAAMADLPHCAKMASQARQARDQAADAASSCCDDGCPNLSGCALGHLATITGPGIWLPNTVIDAPPFALPPVQAHRLSALLRPPITFHG
ncbi:MAG: hypothetical protein ABF356_05015 [Polycyclovorans sp.]